MYSSKDATAAEDNERLVKETVSELGGLDIIIANAGWTRFAKPGDIYDLSLDEWNRVCQKLCRIGLTFGINENNVYIFFPFL
jgi:NAD(P)-dependent dehydrogenase (short-subunit alcohol dehydrogenase family)